MRCSCCCLRFDEPQFCHQLKTLFELKLEVLFPSDGIQPPPSLIEDDEHVEGYICLAVGSSSRIPLCVTPVRNLVSVDSVDENEVADDSQEDEENMEYPSFCGQTTEDLVPADNMPQRVPENDTYVSAQHSCTTPVQQQYFQEYVSADEDVNLDLNATHFPSFESLYSQVPGVPSLNSTPVEDDVYVHRNSNTPCTGTSRHSGKGKGNGTNFIIPSFSREDIPPHETIGASSSECNEDLYVGQVFDSKKVKKQKLYVHALRKNFEFKVNKSSPDIWYIVCVDNNCHWRLRGIQLNNSDMFKISALKNEHTCGMDVRQNNHRQASPWVVGHLIKDKYSLDGAKYDPKHVMSYIQSEFGIQMSYEKAWRCQEKAVEYVRGKPEDAYPKLSSYLYMVQKKNPGTLFDIIVEEDGSFMYCYLAIGACIRGFRFCRPVICVDGAHLKTRYHGHMLCVVALDADDHLFPIAFAIVDSENNDLWAFFIDRLKQTIGDVPGIVFVSDRHAGVLNAVRRLFPEAHHGFCYYHILMKVNAKFKDHHCEAELSAAAYAYRKLECDRHLQVIQEKDPAIAAYLRGIGLEKWRRSYFLGKRYDTVTNNYAESFNSKMKEARKMPATTLLEYIRFTLQNWFSARRDSAEKCKTRLLPEMEKKLIANHNRARFFNPHPLNQTEFHVIDDQGSVEVDIGERMRCDCCKFQLIGIPCELAVAAAMKRGVITYNLCSPYYTTTYLKSTYADTIYPCDNVDEWDVPAEIVNMNVSALIPRHTKTTGRIRMNRIHSQGEKVPRKCSRCQNTGHNRANCNA